MTLRTKIAKTIIQKPFLRRAIAIPAAKRYMRAHRGLLLGIGGGLVSVAALTLLLGSRRRVLAV